MAGTANGAIFVTHNVQFMVNNNDENSTKADLKTHGIEVSATENGNYYDDSDFVFDDYTQRCIIGVIFVIVSTAGTFGNGLVILAVILSRKLRTVTNVFVVNLAVADLLVCLILPWNAVGLFTKPEYDWPLPDQLCVALALIGYTCAGCSIYTLATIAINRWMIITRPARTYRTCYRPAFLATMVIIVWLVPFLITFLPPEFGFGELGYTSKYSTCTHNTDHPLAMYYSLFQSAVLFPVPYIIIIVCYVKIFKHVREHTKVLMNNQDQSVELSDTSSPHARATSGTNRADQTPQRSTNLSVSKKRLSRRQVEITKNLFYVVCAFTICIVPYGVALVIPPSDPVIPWTGALLIVNSCINPFIYATKHPYFKLIFRLMLTCRCAKIPEQSNFLRSMRSTIRQGRSTR